MLLFWDTYTQGMARGINRFRWWEYALSSSLMVMLIAMLFGVKDCFSLILMASINASMNLFGDLFELMNGGRAPS
jgi:Heliorhodopsin